VSAVLQCEICSEDIARFHPKTICYPITGDQFSPKTSNYPMPFDQSVTWETMRCPHCNYRPILLENQIKMKSGRYVILKEFRP